MFVDSTLDTGNLFRTADYIGQRDDGTRVAGFVSHWYDGNHLLTGVLCFEERSDGSVIQAGRTGQFRAKPETLDGIAHDFGLERNMDKSGGISLGMVYDSEVGSQTVLRTLMKDIKERLFAAHGLAANIDYTVLIRWDNIRDDNVYSKLYDIMLMRKRLASIDEELYMLQSQIARAVAEEE